MGVFPGAEARRRGAAPRPGGLKTLDQKAYNTITAALFLVIAALHLLRIIFGWPAQIGGIDIPLWASWLALVVAGALAYVGFRLNLRPGHS
jgi:hypothetical protein